MVCWVDDAQSIDDVSKATHSLQLRKRLNQGSVQRTEREQPHGGEAREADLHRREPHFEGGCASTGRSVTVKCSERLQELCARVNVQETRAGGMFIRLISQRSNLS